MASWQAVAFLPPGVEAVARALERVAGFGCSLPTVAVTMVETGASALLVVDFGRLPRHLWRGTVAALLWTVSATPGALGLVVDWDAGDAVEEWILALRSAELWPPAKRVEAPLVLSTLPSGASRMRVRPDAFFLRA